MKRSLRKALSLPEIVGVLAMVGVLCVTVTPHFLQARKATFHSKLRFNLEKLRQKVEEFRTKNGHPPEDLQDAMDPGETIPENPFCTATAPWFRCAVKKISSDPPGVRDLTPLEMGGWLYNPVTGGVWVDHAQHLSE